MKFHEKTINTLIRLFDTYGGHRSEVRLKRELRNIDFSVYQQQTTGNEVLVETRELNKALKK